MTGKTMKRSIALLLAVLLVFTGNFTGVVTASAEEEYGMPRYMGCVMPQEQWESWCAGEGTDLTQCREPEGEDMEQAASFEDMLALLQETDTENWGYYWILVNDSMTGTLTVPEGMNGVGVTAWDYLDSMAVIDQIDAKSDVVLEGDIGDGREISVTCAENVSVGLMHANVRGVLNGFQGEGQERQPSGRIRFLADYNNVSGITGISTCEFAENQNLSIQRSSENPEDEPVEFYNIEGNSGLNLRIEGYEEGKLPLFHNAFDIGSSSDEEDPENTWANGINVTHYTFEEQMNEAGEMELAEIPVTDIESGMQMVHFADEMSVEDMVSCLERLFYYDEAEEGVCLHDYSFDLTGQAVDNRQAQFYLEQYIAGEEGGSQFDTPQQSFEERGPCLWLGSTYSVEQAMEIVSAASQKQEEVSYYAVSYDCRADGMKLSVHVPEEGWENVGGVNLLSWYEWDEETESVKEWPVVELESISVPENANLVLQDVCAAGDSILNIQASPQSLRLHNCRIKQKTEGNEGFSISGTTAVSILDAAELYAEGQILVEQCLNLEHLQCGQSEMYARSGAQVTVNSISSIYEIGEDGVRYGYDLPVLLEKKGNDRAELNVYDSLDMGISLIMDEQGNPIQDESGNSYYDNALLLFMLDADRAASDGYPIGTLDLFNPNYDLHYDEEKDPGSYIMAIAESDDRIMCVQNGEVVNQLVAIYSDGRLLFDSSVFQTQGSRRCYYGRDAEGELGISGHYVLQREWNNRESITVAVPQSMVYTGSPLTPAVLVKDGEYILKEGKEYTVSWKNNINAGTASAVISYCGDYEELGQEEAVFAISPADISSLTVGSIPDQTVTGSALTPPVTVMHGNRTLKEGTDYTVAYYNNIQSGTAMAIITGRGNYTGSSVRNFTIQERTEEPPVGVSKGKFYTVLNMKFKVTGTEKNGGTVEFVGLVKKVQRVSIPKTVKIQDGTYKVTSIAKNAFKNNTKLKKVVISTNIQTIGASAFEGCKNLKTIQVKTKQLKKVGKKALKGIHKKAVIKIPAAKKKAYSKLLKKKGQSASVKIK